MILLLFAFWLDPCEAALTVRDGVTLTEEQKRMIKREVERIKDEDESSGGKQ